MLRLACALTLGMVIPANASAFSENVPISHQFDKADCQVQECMPIIDSENNLVYLSTSAQQARQRAIQAHRRQEQARQRQAQSRRDHELARHRYEQSRRNAEERKRHEEAWQRQERIRQRQEQARQRRDQRILESNLQRQETLRRQQKQMERDLDRWRQSQRPNVPEQSQNNEERREPQRVLQSSTGDFAQDLLLMINAEREEHGVQPLKLSDDLCRSAAMRATEITKKYRHKRLDGSNFLTAIDGQFKEAAENIGRGNLDAAEAVDDWMYGKEEDRENLLNAKFQEIGVGYVFSSDSKDAYRFVILLCDR